MNPILIYNTLKLHNNNRNKDSLWEESTKVDIHIHMLHYIDSHLQHTSSEFCSGY